MEEAAEFLQRPDLGVHFAEWLDPRGFGPLALLGESATTFSDRFRLARRFIHLLSNAVTFEKVEEGDNVVVICAIHPALRPKARQYAESVVGHCVRNARSLLGLSWNPVQVEFSHASPLRALNQRRFFRCPVRYLSDRDAFVMASKDFYRRLPKGDPDTIAFLEKHLASQESKWPRDLRGQVENLISAQLAGGGASLVRISALLSVSPRTLQRRLAEQGEDFGKMLNFVRTQVARHFLLQTPPPPLAKLCYQLGYSEPSAASRFIRSQLGQSARTIRRGLSTARRGPTPNFSPR